MSASIAAPLLIWLLAVGAGWFAIEIFVARPLSQLEAAARGWFDAEVAEGRVATYETLEVVGFPSRFDLTITAPVLADPARGMAWRAPFAQVFAMSWKPWHLIASLPGGQEISVSGQKFGLDTDRLMASLLLVPGPDLALSEAVVEGVPMMPSTSILVMPLVIWSKAPGLGM